MNTYDDDPTTRRARQSRHSWDESYPGGQDRAPQESSAPRPRASGRASVGRASVPGAVSPANGHPAAASYGPEPTYGAPYGQEPSHEPAYGAAYGVDPYGPTYEPYAQARDPYAAGPHGSYGDQPPVSVEMPPAGPGFPGPMGQPAPGQPMPGRDVGGRDVGSRGVVGRGVVGRAAVRPVSPSGPTPGGGGGSDGPGDDGPSGRGPGGRGPRNPFGRGGRGDGPDGPGGGRRKPPGAGGSKRRKKALRRNIIVSAFAVFIMLAGVGLVGGTYLVNEVKTSDELTFPETTTILFSDGSVLAKLGEVTRYPLKFDEMNDAVIESIVASEDNTFWENEGVDLRGIMRAAWNNFTGGSTQGASTITQQYARVAFELDGSTSYTRKINEAVTAWKIDDQLSKQEILENYLNSVPFGRQTYGIEAAAQSFFGKTAKKTAPPEQQVTDAEAMVLVSMVKQPNPDPDDPTGSPGYDPTFTIDGQPVKKAEENAKERWEYVRGQMVELGRTKPGPPDRPLTYLSEEENSTIEFPKLESFKPYNADAGNGVEKPAGMVINHVLSELTHTDTPFKGRTWKSIKEGGYQIYTTIHPGAQAAAEAAADETLDSSPMKKHPANLQAALVAVEPGTGRVLAYYGGHDGKGTDYAGIYFDDQGDGSGFGRYPPGSSFKVYTLAAALKAGISLNSWWDSSSPHDFPGRVGAKAIRNASSCVEPNGAKNGPCTLLGSTTASLNVPFFGVTQTVGSANVIAMAKAAGIDYMWTDKRERIDLNQYADMGEVSPNFFDLEVGIGQYSITVMDHANGLATFAAGGARAKAHFVTKVMEGDSTVYGETLPTGQEPRVLNPQQSADLTYALSKVSTASLGNGWNSAGKTGTWEYNQNRSQNAHAWMAGFTRKLAAAVWVGNEKDEQAIKLANGKDIFGSDLPGPMWKQFMVAATKAMDLKNDNSTKFGQPVYVGDDTRGNIASPAPPPPDPNQFPTFPTLPPGNGTGNGNGNDGRGNGVPRLPSTPPPPPMPLPIDPAQ